MSLGNSILNAVERAGNRLPDPLTIFFILIGAGLFNFFLENTGLPQLLIEQIRSSGMGPMAVMVITFATWRR